MCGPEAHGQWRPLSLSHRALFRLYCSIFLMLADQFDVAPPGTYSALHGTVPGPLGPIALIPVETRFALNVIVEAIVSAWTDTPLPHSVSHERTRALARWAGWAPWGVDGGPTPPACDGKVYWECEDIAALARRFSLVGSGSRDDREFDVATLECPRESSRVRIIDIDRIIAGLSASSPVRTT